MTPLDVVHSARYEPNKTPVFYQLQDALQNWRTMKKVSIRNATADAIQKIQDAATSVINLPVIFYKCFYVIYSLMKK